MSREGADLDTDEYGQAVLVSGGGRPADIGGLIDAQAAGELLGVRASWVLAQARRNAIPHVRLGRYVRFEAVALEAWWEARRRGPKVAPGRARA